MKYILELDQFAGKELDIIGQKRYQTLFGALLTVGLYVFTGTITIKLLIDLFSKQSPVVNYSEEYDPIPDALRVDLNDFLVFFAFTGSPTIFRSEAYMTYVVDEANQIIDFVPCNYSYSRYNPTDNEDLKYELQDAYCMNLTQWDELKQKQPTSPQFYFQRCLKSTTEYCDFAGSIGHGAVEFVYLRFSVNAIASTKQQAIQSYYTKKTISVSDRTGTLILYDMQKVSVVDFFNPFYLGGEETTQIGYKVLNADETKTDGYGPIVLIIWQQFQVSGSYERSYGTILDVIAWASGIKDFLNLLVVTLFSSLFQANFQFSISSSLNGRIKSQNRFKQLMNQFIGPKSTEMNKQFKKIEDTLTVHSIITNFRRLDLLQQVLFTKEQLFLFQKVQSVESQDGNPLTIFDQPFDSGQSKENKENDQDDNSDRKFQSRLKLMSKQFSKTNEWLQLPVSPNQSKTRNHSSGKVVPDGLEEIVLQPRREY